MGDSPGGNFATSWLVFFNTIHFKLLKIRRVVGGPSSDTRKKFLIDSHEVNLWGSLKSVIALSVTWFLAFTAFS